MHQNLSKISFSKMSKLEDSELILNHFVGQQDKLLKALLASFPNFSDFDRLTDFTQSEGILEVLGTQWKFQKHGIGFTFSETKGKTVINMHKWLSNPEFFDACRMSSYLSSIRWKGEKHFPPSERTQVYSEKGAKEWLKKMVDEGIIKAVLGDKTHYQLVQRSFDSD
jgi:hypothetical protein